METLISSEDSNCLPGLVLRSLPHAVEGISNALKVLEVQSKEGAAPNTASLKTTKKLEVTA